MLDKVTENCHVIDVAIPNDKIRANNVIEKITNYNGLKAEITRFFGMQEY